MYEYEGLKDMMFIALYCVAAFAALVAAGYLLWRRGNAFMQEEALGGPERLWIRSSLRLRRWTAVLMLAVFMSHVWWAVPVAAPTGDATNAAMTGESVRLLRNIVCITLDRLSFVPLMMCVLLRMLQDRRRPAWPVWAAVAPVAVLAVVCIATGSDVFEPVVEWYMAVVALAFLVYYVRAVRQYGRWLNDNFADLENKEVWQSLLLLAFTLFVHVAYSTNGGALVTEYLAQVNTLVIIAFLLWRVETLEELPSEEEIES